MTAQILDGTATLATIKNELKARIAALAERGIVPGLGTVRVGQDPGTRWYVNAKHKDCAEVVPDARDADLGAVLVLGIDVPPGAWVLANPHGPETGDDAAFCQRRDAGLELVLDRCEGRPAIQDLRGHVLNPSTAGAAQPWWSSSRDELPGMRPARQAKWLGPGTGMSQQACPESSACDCRLPLSCGSSAQSPMRSAARIRTGPVAC